MGLSSLAIARLITGLALAHKESNKRSTEFRGSHANLANAIYYSLTVDVALTTYPIKTPELCRFSAEYHPVCQFRTEFLHYFCKPKGYHAIYKQIHDFLISENRNSVGVSAVSLFLKYVFGHTYRYPTFLFPNFGNQNAYQTESHDILADSFFSDVQHSEFSWLICQAISWYINRKNFILNAYTRKKSDIQLTSGNLMGSKNVKSDDRNSGCNSVDISTNALRCISDTCCF